jgi:hypothetical protein
MESSSSDPPFSCILRPFVGRFGPSPGHLPTQQAHSSRRPLNYSFSQHPKVANRKQCCQLRLVFDKATILGLAIIKLEFDQHEGVFHFGPNAGLNLLLLSDQAVYSFALLQSPALTRHHGNLPVNSRVLRFNLFTIGDGAVARISKHDIFFSVQQSEGLRNVLLIGSSARDRMNQPKLSGCANVQLHAEVPLVAFLGLVHFWVKLPRVVLGGAGSDNQGCINDSTRFEQQTPLDQLGVHGGKNLRGQVVGFKHVTESEDGALTRQAGGVPIELGDLTNQGNVVQGLINAQIRQAKILLHELDSKHHGTGKRNTPRFACRRKGLDQANQLRPIHNKVHLVEKLTLASSHGDQFKFGGGECGLFHEKKTFASGVAMTFSDLP